VSGMTTPQAFFYSAEANGATATVEILEPVEI
jgi:hypothetical protein